MLLSGLCWLAFHSLGSVALFGGSDLPSRECFCRLMVAERSRGGLGEKAGRVCRKELRGSCPHQEVGSPGSRRCGGKRGSCKQVAVRPRIIWRDTNEWAREMLGLEQAFESPGNGVELAGGPPGNRLFLG